MVVVVLKTEVKNKTQVPGEGTSLDFSRDDSPNGAKVTQMQFIR